MSNRLLTLSVLTILSSGPVSGQAVDAGAFALPAMQLSARSAVLGAAPSVGPVMDAASFVSNPALLDERYDRRITAGLLNHLSSVRTGAFSYARSLPSIGMLGMSLRFLSWGAIERTDASGEVDGDFSAGEMDLSVSASRAYGNRLRYGASVRYLRSAIDGHAVGALAADLGVVATWSEQRLAVSASLHQVGFVIGSIGTTDDELPVDLRIAVSKRLLHLPLLFTVTAYGLAGADSGDDVSGVVDRVFRHLVVGTEFQFSESFQLRFGYDHRRHAALKTRSRLDLAGLSIGTGIRIRRFGLDYGWTSWSSLGGLHRITITTTL